MTGFNAIIKRVIRFINIYFIYVSVAFVVIIFLGGYLFFIQAKIAKIGDLGGVNYQQKLQERDLKKSNLLKLEQAKKNFDQIDVKEIEKFSSILPSQDDIPALLVRMDNFAKDLGLTLTSIDITEKSAVALPSTATAGQVATSTGTIKQVGITISIKGLYSYDDFKKFLDSVEQNMPLMDISSIAYVPGSDSYTVNLTTYYIQ